MIESGITSKGQTTIPKAVREALGVKPGDRIRYAILDERVMMLPALPAARLYGRLQYNGPPKSLDEIDRALGEAVAEQ